MWVIVVEGWGGQVYLGIEWNAGTGFSLTITPNNVRVEIFRVYWAGTFRDDLHNSGVVSPGILDLCHQCGPWGWCSPYRLGNINGMSPVRSWPSHSLLCGVSVVVFLKWSLYSAMINVNNEWNTILECELQHTTHQISLRIRKWY